MYFSKWVSTLTSCPAALLAILPSLLTTTLSLITSTMPPSTAPPHAFTSLLDPGILRDTLLPNLIIQTTLTLPVYAVARLTNYAEAKDILWPTSQLFAAYYAAIGRHLVAGVPLSTAYSAISRPGKLVLTGVTLWAGRLFYRVTTRALRRGTDDARYPKSDAGYWNSSLLTQWIPEIVTQALITLPFTAPFRVYDGNVPVLTPPRGYEGMIEGLAVAAFGAGLALEVFADSQLESYKQKGGSGVLREGVWSVVRHPK